MPCQGRPGTPAASSGARSAVDSRPVISASPYALNGECAQWVESSAAARCGTGSARMAESRGKISPSGRRITSYAAVRAGTGPVNCMSLSVARRSGTGAGLSARSDWPDERRRGRPQE